MSDQRILPTMTSSSNYTIPDTLSFMGTQELGDVTCGVYEGVAQGPLAPEDRKCSRSERNNRNQTDTVSPSLAYLKFQGHPIPHQDYDPTGRITLNNTAEPYRPDASHPFMESPLQRISRLKKEVDESMMLVKHMFPTARDGNESKNDVELTSHDDLHAENDNTSLNTDPIILLEELNSIRSQLESINLSQHIGEIRDEKAEFCFGCPEKERQILDLLSRLMPTEQENTKHILSSTELQLITSHLSSIQLKLNNAAQKQESSTPSTEQLQQQQQQPFTYEFYSVPSHTPPVQIAHILQLERRVTQMESAIGINASSHLRIPYPNIISALQDILSSLSLMYPDRIQYIVDRFKNLNGQIDDFIRNKNRLTGTVSGTLGNKENERSQADAIQDLYFFSQSARPVIATLPSIVERLRNLKWLHHNASGINQRILDLENQQKELGDSLEVIENDVSSLRDTISESITYAKQIINDIHQKQPS